MHVYCGEQAAWCAPLVNLAPLLVEQLADAAFLGSDLLKVVQAIEKEVAQVGDISLTLHPHVDDISARGTMDHVQEMLAVRRAGRRS